MDHSLIPDNVPSVCEDYISSMCHELTSEDFQRGSSYPLPNFSLLFYLQCPQVFLLLGRDSVALDGLLYSLVVRPVGKAALLDVRNRLVPLLGKGCGKEPGNHHLYIILFAPY